MASEQAEKDVLLAEYNQVVAQFRALMDIRFKLLAYLPLGTVAAVFLSKEGQLASEPAIAVFAFLATLCIATYNKRNDQHYDELVARAAELERDNLGLAHGSFAQRPASWLKYGWITVEHRWPIGLLYASSAALWAFIAVKSLIGLCGQPTAFAISLELLTPVIVIAFWLMLHKLESSRRKKLRNVIFGLKAELVTDVAPGEDSEEELKKAIASHQSILGIEDIEKAKLRVHYHWPAYASKYDVEAGSRLLSAVIDLPARWITDLWTGRR
jgi:hypothetical protein